MREITLYPSRKKAFFAPKMHPYYLNNGQEIKLDKAVLYKGEMVVYMGPGGHPYFNEKGDRLLSVSGINGIMDKPALMYWASSEAAQHIAKFWDTKVKYTEDDKLRLCEEAYTKFRKTKEKKAERGTAVHDFAEAFVKGDGPAMPSDPNIRNGANAFMKWFTETELKPVYTERVVGSKKMNIAGRLDLIAKDKKGQLHVIDYKSVSMYKKAKIWQKEFPGGFVLKADGSRFRYPVFDGPIIQTAAYRGFIMEETGKEYGESYVVRFDQEFGDFDVTSVPVKLQDEAYKCFKHNLGVKKYLDKFGVK